MDDAALLAGWRDGDRRAGQELVGRHYQAVFLFLLGKVDEQTSADLTQDTFETICEDRDRFRGESSLRTYLFGIARWKLVNHLRSRQRANARFDPLCDGIEPAGLGPSVTSLFTHKEHETIVVLALRSLPLDDQLLLELKEYESLTARELATIFEVPAGTIAGRIKRARERLRQAIERVSATPVLADQTLRGLDSYFRGVRSAMEATTA